MQFKLGLLIAGFSILLQSAAFGAVLIHEVAPGCNGVNTAEFVELYNNGSAPVDLTGWTLARRSKASSADDGTLALSGTIAPNGYFLIAGGTYSTLVDLPINDNTVGILYPAADLYDAGGAVAGPLSANNAQLGLKNASGVLVDAMGYGQQVDGTFTSEYVETAPKLVNGFSSRRSLSRDNVTHSDTGDNSVDFIYPASDVMPGAMTPTNSTNTQASKAWNPRPANNAVNVSIIKILGWNPGPGTISHDVYFGTDAAAVSDATPATTGVFKGSQPVDANTFQPAALEFSTNYYWRIDEVNEPNVWKGPVWQFTTGAFLTLDDFESFADTAAMLGSWVDGSDLSSGSTATLSTSTGHNQLRSLKFDYDNSGAASKPYFSEVSSSAFYSDWTVNSIAAIDIWYKGSATNAAEPMYMALERIGNTPAVVVNPDPNAAKAADWQVWRIALTDFAGVDLSDVTKLYIGFGNRLNPQAGGTGTVYIDDIQLHPRRLLYPPKTDLTGDDVVDFTDFAIFAQKWLTESIL